jgi:acetyl-CoA synthetase (ADP-forming)
MSEHEAKQLLARHGLVVNREMLVDTADEAVAAAEEIGYPVVAKLSGDSIQHKTELGGVRLGLVGPEAVRSAVNELREFAPPDSRILVAEQVEGSRELVIGATADPQFGMVLMLGIGGTIAEMLGDVTFRLLPADRSDLESMIADLQLADLLGEFRGEPPVDRSSLVAAMESVARCAEADGAITAIDVNPLIVRDGRPVAVDALVVRR